MSKTDEIFVDNKMTRISTENDIFKKNCIQSS